MTILAMTPGQRATAVEEWLAWLEKPQVHAGAADRGLIVYLVREELTALRADRDAWHGRAEKFESQARLAEAERDALAAPASTGLTSHTTARRDD